MIATRRSATIHGYGAVPLTVECEAGPGLPAFAVVGLPDGAVRESRDRILSALRHGGYRLPPRRITANLAPGDLRKEGTAFDLPLALAVLEACEQIQVSPGQADRVFLGELGLDGRVRSIRGLFALAMGLRDRGLHRLVVPEGNRAEIVAIDGLDVIGVDHLHDAVRLLETGQRPSVAPLPVSATDPGGTHPDLAEVRGQEEAKQALVVAASGGHNVLLVGSPGAGKTMLARRFAGILPELEPERALEITRIHSLAGLHRPGSGLVSAPPFRAPHHSSTVAALIGGGACPRPGEISLAHGGVLFLDELAEFPRMALESLRQPLEEGEVCLSRSRQAVRFPARFLLVAATNPCPCGFLGDARRTCTCSTGARDRYRTRLSGPLLDRIDLHLPLPVPGTGELIASVGRTTSTATARARVLEAIDYRRRRGQDRANASLEGDRLDAACGLGPSSRTLLERAGGRLGLSGRGIARVLRVARSIADLEREPRVGEAHLAQALSFRSADSRENR